MYMYIANFEIWGGGGGSRGRLEALHNIIQYILSSFPILLLVQDMASLLVTGTVVYMYMYSIIIIVYLNQKIENS